MEPFRRSVASVGRVAALSAALLALLLATAACGRDGNAEPAATATATGTAAIDTGAAANATAAATPVETRTVDLAGGIVEVPIGPQRVVVLQSFILPHVLSMGVEPIVVGLSDVTVDPNEILPPWLDASVPADVTTFSEREPDVELIASLDPDLIVAFRAIDGIEQLRQIAPVAVVDRIALEWRELTEGVAEVFGERDRFEGFMADYEARVARFRQETAPELGDRTVSAFRVRGPDKLRIEVLDSFPGQILAAAGVARPEAQDREGDTGFGYLEVSTERFAEADADLMFAITYDRRPQTKDDLRTLTQTPIWQALRGVQSGQVFEVDGATWFGGHPLAAIALLDDLAAAVSGDLSPYKISDDE